MLLIDAFESIEPTRVSAESRSMRTKCRFERGQACTDELGAVRPSGRCHRGRKFTLVVLSSLALAKGQHGHKVMNCAQGRHRDSAMSRPPLSSKTTHVDTSAGGPMPPGRWHRRHASATSP